MHVQDTVFFQILSSIHDLQKTFLLPRGLPLPRGLLITSLPEDDELAAEDDGSGSARHEEDEDEAPALGRHRANRCSSLDSSTIPSSLSLIQVWTRFS